MLSALITGIIGSLLTFAVGVSFFGFGWVDGLAAIAASNVAGFFSLLLTLFLERRPMIRKVLMGNAIKTWTVLAILYTAFMVALDPGLRHPLTVLVLFAPLVLATGLMLPLWGPTQDRIIRLEHRLSKRRAFARNQEFAAPETDAIRMES